MDCDVWHNAGIPPFDQNSSIKVNRCWYSHHKWIKMHIVARFQPLDTRDGTGFHLLHNIRRLVKFQIWVHTFVCTYVNTIPPVAHSDWQWLWTFTRYTLNQHSSPIGNDWFFLFKSLIYMYVRLHLFHWSSTPETV